MNIRNHTGEGQETSLTSQHQHLVITRKTVEWTEEKLYYLKHELVTL